MRVYLAGHINKNSYKWRNEWTTTLESLNHIVLDPEKVDYETYGHNIVKIDKQLLLKSDILLANITHASVGTSMEIMFAYLNNIPIYFVASNQACISDWHIEHGIMITSFEDFLWILREIQNTIKS